MLEQVYVMEYMPYSFPLPFSSLQDTYMHVHMYMYTIHADIYMYMYRIGGRHSPSSTP